MLQEVGGLEVRPAPSLQGGPPHPVPQVQGGSPVGLLAVFPATGSSDVSQGGRPLASGLQVETRCLEAGVPSPLPPQPQAGEAPALSLGALRYGTGVELAGSQGEATLYLPVNPGLEPQDLELKLSLPAGLLQGCLDVLSEGYPSFHATLPTETLLSTREPQPQPPPHLQAPFPGEGEGPLHP
jgi:hypothetical protein